MVGAVPENGDEPVHIEGQEHRLAAILVGDVAGYTRLVGEDEDHTVRTLAAYQQEIELLVRQHRGRLVDFAAGDGFLAEFPSAVYAVRSALEIQAVLHARNDQLPEEKQLEFRIGAHLGDVRVEEERLVGSGVNVAARLEPLAEPGGLCISERIREDIRGRLELDLEDLGPQELKNAPEPVRAFAVAAPEARDVHPQSPITNGSAKWLGSIAAILVAFALSLGSWWLLRGGDNAGSELLSGAQPVVAVLPFDDMSAEGDQQYFSDGLAEEVLSALTRIEGVSVVARTSAFAFRGEEDIRSISETLNATAILEGSVRKAANRLRVTVQLIDSASGFHLWSDTYDVNLQDVFEVQDLIASQVVAALQAQFSLPTAEAQRSERHPIQPHTYDLYLRAKHEYSQADQDAVALAIELLERVTRDEPDFAPAYGLSAHAYLTLGGFGAIPRERANKLAREKAIEALRLDPGAAAAHAALGSVRMQADWDWHGAEQSYKDAIRQEPSAFNLQLYSELLTAVGRPSDAVAVARRAADLDPLNWNTAWQLGRALSAARQPVQALSHFTAAKRLADLPDYAREDIIEAYWVLRRDDDVIREGQELLVWWARTFERASPEAAGAYRVASARLGELYVSKGFANAWRYYADLYMNLDVRGAMPSLDRARAALGESGEWTMSSCCSSQIARFYAQIGDADRAIELLIRAFETREWGIQFIKAWASFEDLRGEAHYQQLVSDMGLAQSESSDEQQTDTEASEAKLRFSAALRHTRNGRRSSRSWSRPHPRLSSISTMWRTRVWSCSSSAVSWTWRAW